MKYASIALAAALTASGAVAQDTGPTSRASIGISLSVAPRAVVSKIPDRMFGDDGHDSVDDVCLWMNTSTRGYSITAVGSGDGGAFLLGDGAARRSYAVSWSEGTADAVALAAGARSQDLRSDADGPACGSGRPNAHLRIGMSAASGNAEPTAGTVSILIAPM